MTNSHLMATGPEVTADLFQLVYPLHVYGCNSYHNWHNSVIGAAACEAGN